MPSSAAIAPKPVATLRPDGRHDQSHGGLQEQEQEIGLDSALGIDVTLEQEPANKTSDENPATSGHASGREIQL